MSTIGHVIRQLRVQASNWWRADSTARAATAATPLPDAPVAVFFAGGPVELYQLADWLPVLEDLDEVVPLVVVCTRPDGARAAMAATRLPVRLAKGAPDLERLVRSDGVRGVLYVNHLERNFRMLRFAEPVHVYLGHGESDKDSSISNQNKAYDYSFVAGPAGRDRLQRVLRGYDAAVRAPMVGRPQLDHDSPGAPSWERDGRTRVLYAPTWEGDRPAMSYGSVATHGVALVRALVEDGGFRVVYRPHPRSGTTSDAYRRADHEVRALLESPDHLVDTGPYGWQRAFADVCVTDVSSVAYDWAATGKPLVVTLPGAAATPTDGSRLLDAVPRLAASEASRAPALLRSLGEEMPAGWSEVVEHYVGDTTPGAATARFRAAVLEALRS
ncbi:CDP-glycerol glycerophosphotransferase family protein [Phycicoccus sonneratiae]|uniref:CDP-glycerol glycerophosphotransferase family protein n=1 Tax=Phycicoccus sonneratiae TaxID=2807628 RepID=A0ABS2CMI8_9MICO|nr:CDP-glycerol glycerophosphotransferase family protein [Phycicoccus sonneraticus]MBM6400990.1 CDP-glycerol glycerophosphotransferase family protein [Phycicoccus sonneraticus]